jgi:hypothetical protein
MGRQMVLLIKTYFYVNLKKTGFRMGRQLVLLIKSPSGKARLQYIIKNLFPILCKIKFKFMKMGPPNLKKR